MPISCLTNCLSSSSKSGFIFPFMAICRMNEEIPIPAFAAFCFTTKNSDFVNLIPFTMSLFTGFFGLPPECVVIVSSLVIFLNNFFCDQREKKQAEFLCNKNTACLERFLKVSMHRRPYIFLHFQLPEID